MHGGVAPVGSGLSDSDSPDGFGTGFLQDWCLEFTLPPLLVLVPGFPGGFGFCAPVSLNAIERILYAILQHQRTPKCKAT